MRIIGVSIAKFIKNMLHTHAVKLNTYVQFNMGAMTRLQTSRWPAKGAMLIEGRIQQGSTQKLTKSNCCFTQERTRGKSISGLKDQ